MLKIEHISKTFNPGTVNEKPVSYTHLAEKEEERVMKKIAAMVLAGVLAAVPVSTIGAAEFQDGADTQNFIWAAGYS